MSPRILVSSFLGLHLCSHHCAGSLSSRLTHSVLITIQVPLLGPHPPGPPPWSDLSYFGVHDTSSLLALSFLPEGCFALSFPPFLSLSHSMFLILHLLFKWECSPRFSAQHFSASTLSPWKTAATSPTSHFGPSQGHNLTLTLPLNLQSAREPDHPDVHQPLKCLTRNSGFLRHTSHPPSQLP